MYLTRNVNCLFSINGMKMLCNTAMTVNVDIYYYIKPTYKLLQVETDDVK